MVWNLRAEAGRMIRTQLPALPPGRHRELAEQVTALAASPPHSVSVEAPAMLDEPPELRRADGGSVFDEHAAARYTRSPPGSGTPGVVTSAGNQDAKARLVSGR
jgi:hypothetical protein